MPSRSDIIREARSWIGVPFRHQGRNRRGVDCIGHVLLVMNALGMELDDQAREALERPKYGLRPNGHQLVRACEANGEAVPNGEHLPGDVVIMAWHKFPMHIGFLGDLYGDVKSEGPMSLIHSYSDMGKVAEHTFSREWSRRVRATFRLKGV